MTDNGAVMSVMPIQKENSWQGIGPFNSLPINPTVIRQSVDIDVLNQIDESASYLEIPCRLMIPQAPFQIPEQNFLIVFNQFGATFENTTAGSWPKIFIEFESDFPLGKFRARELFSRLRETRVKTLLIEPSNHTVDAECLYTRLMFSLCKAGEFNLLSTGIGRLLRIEFEAPSESLRQRLLHWAKLSRKLKYIERVFNIKFTLPQECSADEVYKIETIFRGITESEFALRSSDITFVDIPSSEIDLTRPPFDGIGSFSRIVGSYTELFGKNLDTGPLEIILEKAELADPNVIRQIRSGSTKPMNVRFEVLDNQVVHRFESYARQPHKRLAQRLNRFKQELAREEPPELVDLVTESLQSDVSFDETHQIAVGWQFYNHLPDRFCPQDPEIDPATGHWRVPVWLVYTNGEGGPVGEIMIDRKTGKIISHTSIEEMRSQASSLIDKYDEEVLTTARKFMDRHDKLLRRLAE
ncbi:MAG: hypothetical protein AB1631_06175 [Acidobacteriota bacterium]